MEKKATICEKYNQIAYWFDSNRTKGPCLMEQEYLNSMLTQLPKNGTILDLGCGSGEPLAGFFIRHGYSVTGIDGASNMIELCRNRFPEMTWLVADMRKLDLKKTFDGIIAWDSFFHLTREDQREMFQVFSEHLAPEGLLLFTSGPADGEITGVMEGEEFYYSSLSATEYRTLCKMNGFEVIISKVEDPNCGGHTVWLAQKLK